MYKTKLNKVQQIFTKQQYDQLLQNGANRDQDHAPVVKFFNAGGQGDWLISEIDPNDPFIAFGLCDLGYPELGDVDLRDFIAYNKSHIFWIERDLHFKGNKPMSHYVNYHVVVGDNG